MRRKIGLLAIILAFFILPILPLSAATGTVSGKVVMPDGTDLESGLKVDVYLSSELAAIIQVAEPQNLEGGVDDTFSFAIDVPDDVYIFIIPSHSSDYAYYRSSILQLTPDSPDYNAGNVQINNTQLRGTVTDSQGHAVSGAVVSVHNNDNSVQLFSQTDFAGIYNLGGAPDGTELWMEASGPDDTYHYDNIEQFFTVSASIQTYDIQAENATKQVSGTVLFPDGSPVDNNTQVIILPTTAGRGWQQTWTDSAGNYSTYVNGGSWIVRPNFDRFNNSGWAYLEAPTQVDFNNDETTETATANFIVEQATGTIEGYALNADGSVPALADVSLVLANGAVSSTKVDATTGYFSVTVPPNVWTIKISTLPSRADIDSLFTPITVTVADGETKNLGNISGQDRSVVVSGRVIDDSGSAVSGVSIDVYGPDLNYNYNSAGYSGITTEADGSFIFNTPPGYLIFTPSVAGLIDNYKVESGQTANIPIDATEYAIGDLVLEKLDGVVTGNLGVDVDEGTGYAVDAEGKTYVSDSVTDGQFNINIPDDESVTVGFYSVPNSPYAVFDTQAATNNQTVDLQTTAADAELSGDIKNEGGSLVAEHIRVIATSQNAVYTTETTNGEYDMPLPVGDWQVNYEIMDEQEAYLEINNSTAVSITSTEQKVQDFTAITSDATIIGQVLDSESNALPYASVYAYDGENLLLSEADDSGNYSLPVKGGEMYLVGTGDHPNTADLSQNPNKIEVPANETVTNNITYENASAVVEGKVTLDGAAVPSGYVQLINSDGRFNSVEIDSVGNFEAPVVKGEELIVQALYLDDGKYYESEETTITASNDDNTQNLSIALDESVQVPALVKEEIADVTQAEIIDVNSDLQIFIPPYALGTSDSATVIVSPTIDVASQTSGESVNFGYDLVAKDSEDVVITNLNAPITIAMKYQDEQITKNDLLEEAITPRYEDPASEILAPISVATLDKENNQVSFVTQHLSKFILTSVKDQTAIDVPVAETPTKIKKLKVANKWTNKIKLKWQAQEDIDYYQIRVLNKNGKKIKTIHSHKKYKVIKKLKADTLYKFKVRGVRDDLKGKWSKVLKVRTKNLLY